MPQTHIQFDIPAGLAIPLSQALETALEQDGFPVAVFETDEEKAIWTVSVYCDGEKRAYVRGVIDVVLAETGIGPGITEETLEDENWVEKTLQDLAPVRAGRFVVHGSHDRGTVRAHEHGILIDAAMAFGTGHHGTTAGCLFMLDRAMKRQRYANALDLGTGTGVLAIAIARAAHIPVLATDIDPVATRIAVENARLNGVSAGVSAVTASGFAHRAITARKPYDLIVANILAGPLQTMAHDFARHLASSGTAILSGLLPHQKARIVAAYRAQGLHLLSAHYQDGWMTLEFSRP
ncbi:MAG: 50S ribosomal protein L11 methyltransferase [Nitratireductor sp.]|nr:50S ribosomal protein L11 methyltransferase [Nitratireductor sp.]